MGSLDAGTLSARVAASRAICLAVLAMGGVAPSLVRAQSTEVPLRVRVTLAGCAAGDETARELMRLVRLELGSDGVEEVVTSARDDVRARIDVAGFPCNSPSEPPTPHNRSTLVGRRDPPAPEPPDRAGDASPRLPERTQGRSERRTPGESRVTSRISIA
ncbi:MAG: hypothetical protein IT379_29180, partial [Deltaproteobacteria bacterium]|nr:hypothetical protein [Deltaproteobacteria bacterium]